MAVAKESSVLKAGVISIILCMAGISNQVAALIQKTGGQACQPANIGQALQGISWQSSGIYNRTARDLWVICPIVTNWDDTEPVRVYVGGKNDSDETTSISCVAKVVDAGGDAISTTMNDSGDVSPGNIWGFNFFDVVVGSNQDLAVSCKLKPNTGISTLRTLDSKR